MSYLKELKTSIKGISLRDADTLMAYFGDYWKGNKAGHTGYVAASLNIMGNYFAKANFRVYQDNNGELTEQKGHRFLELLENPNNFQVENELKSYIGQFLAVYGNFYLYKVRGVNSKKVIGYQVLMPKLVSPVSTDKQWVAYYEYQVGTQTIQMPREDIIHFKYLTPYSQVEGTPLINAISDVLDINAYQTAYMKEFYKNGGFLGQVFSTPQNLRPQEFNRLKEELRNEYAGEGKSHKMALFTGGLEPVKTSYSLKDMEMTIQRKLTLSEVMTAFRIPQILYGGEGADYTFATAKAAEANYASTMIEPSLTYIDQVFTKHAKIDFSKNIKIIHDSISPKDTQENLQYYKDMFSVGAITINEIRELENYDRLDYPLADVNMINVGGALVRLDTGDQLGQTPNNVESTPQDDTEDSQEKSFDTDTLKLHWKQAQRWINKDLKWFERRVNEFFDAQKSRLLDNLNLKDVLVETLLESEDEMAIIFNMIENAYMRFLERGFSYSGATGERVIYDGLKAQLQQHSRSINDTSKQKIMDRIKKEGISRELIDKIYDNFKEMRSPLIAETTGVSAFNAGLWLGYRTQGYTKKTWISQKDDKVRHSHFVVDGQKVDIDDVFIVGDSALMFPGDPTANPEEVINCRCILIGEK